MGGDIDVQVERLTGRYWESVHIVRSIFGQNDLRIVRVVVVVRNQLALEEVHWAIKRIDRTTHVSHVSLHLRNWVVHGVEEGNEIYEGQARLVKRVVWGCEVTAECQSGEKCDFVCNWCHLFYFVFVSEFVSF